MLDNIKQQLMLQCLTPSPGVSLPDLNAAVMHDPRKVKVLGKDLNEIITRDSTRIINC